MNIDRPTVLPPRTETPGDQDVWTRLAASARHYFGANRGGANHGGAKQRGPECPEPPIRAELFSLERLEQHAQSLAASQQVGANARGRLLERRLRDNERALNAAYRITTEETHHGRALSPAAGWLVDNFHVVQEQVRAIQTDLPPGFQRQLPHLSDGPFAGFPRVYGLAWALIAHTDSCVEPDMLRRFLTAYQSVQPLTIGELWAVAIAIRIVLVENLRRLADGLVADQGARQQADDIAAGLLRTPPAAALEGAPDAASEASWRIARHELENLPRPLQSAFAVQLLRCLREEDPVVAPALRWLDDALSHQGTTAEAIVAAEQQHEGAANVTVRNVITSMRLMSSINWPDLVESVCPLDDILAAASNFAALDFATRELYRHAIEEIARRCPHAECDVARMVLQQTAAAAASAPFDAAARKRADPAYYLIGKGRPDFERFVGFRVTLRQAVQRRAAASGACLYLSLIIGITCIVLVCALAATAHATPGWALALLALMAFLPASDIATVLVQSAVANCLTAMALPAMEMRHGVPESLRTMIATPTLLSSQASIAAQVRNLEVQHLANNDGDLCFALLADFTDADTQTQPEDAGLLQEAAMRIGALNERYGPAPSGRRFLLLHRRRLWNDSEGQWMGWERKRGKLHELNRLLRGATDTSFVDGPENIPAGVRYVIVLDGDTRLPRGAARRLIGKMAHPMNQPVADRTGRVIDGYGVLQPRVTPLLPCDGEGSLYQWAFSNGGGMDPYSFAVSDLYQDMCGEGSYCGKGIYDVDAFEAALRRRIPENTLLSHDLLEGIFARAGLASDIEVIDAFPARMDVAASRQIRWARGDWQLLPWLAGWPKRPIDENPQIDETPPIDENRQSDPPRGGMSLIGRWKMLDNLRRTLSAPGAFLALTLGWRLLPAHPLRWTAFILCSLTIAALLPAAAGIIPRRLGLSKLMHLYAALANIRLAAVQAVLMLAFLPYQAWIMGEAIGRTLYRLFVSRRHLLEWVTAENAQARPLLNMAASYQRMFGGIVLAGTAALVLIGASGATHMVAAPFLVLWLLAPAIAWRISQTETAEMRPATPAQHQALRLIARRTWRFFETFVTADDNMLPPDNFQEDPRPVIAHRTSPTNIGLYLLSVTAAADFGWISVANAAERLEATLATTQRLHRHRGHLLNWYDTQDLRPLEPAYVSAVDSGNLAGHLIAVWNFCEAAVVPADWRGGITDALLLLRQAVGSDTPLDGVMGALAQELGIGSKPLFSARKKTLALDFNLERAAALAEELVALARETQNQNAIIWAEAVHATAQAHLQKPDEAALTARLHAIAASARALFDGMAFGFLFNEQRGLLAVGHRVADGTLEDNCYDLLASEARLASFVAIAKGDLPTRHWFRLGRPMVAPDANAALVSWSGSMFEYLMPSLVMRAPAASLMAATNRHMLREQMRYGAQRGVPWGASESAYAARDLEYTYQYSSFGIPSLALKFGLGDNTVIAPYATALAVMVDPGAAAENFAALAEQGGDGAYGYYEALDYTASRVPAGSRHVVVRATMAHHQGMSIVAIANAVSDGAIRRRFHAEPMIEATELLLQERMPQDVAIARPLFEAASPARNTEAPALSAQRRFETPHSAAPQTHLMSNGTYAVMVTATGTGYSQWHGLALTRWREDPTQDGWGSYIYLRDRKNGAVWSAGYQPTRREPDRFQAAFTEGRAELARRDGDITTLMEIAVSSEDDAEVRRISLTNHGNQTHYIEVTSYAELVLAPAAADTAHQAFSKMFVETSFLPEMGALLATRRRRTPDEPPVWAAHTLVLEGETVGDLQYETDRARFLGRGQSIAKPLAMQSGTKLGKSAGAVLDPIFSLRRMIRLPPKSTARIAFWTMAADSHEAIVALLDRHRAPAAFERATTLAWTQAQLQLRHLGLDEQTANLFQRIAGRLIYSSDALRPPETVIARGAGAASQLWQHGISGDRPIVLVTVTHESDLDLIRALLLAYEYWGLKQLIVDLVILNEQSNSYAQAFQSALVALANAKRLPQSSSSAAGKGAIFVLRADLMPPASRALLAAAARAVFEGKRGSLANQMAQFPHARKPPPQPAKLVTPPAVAKTNLQPGRGDAPLQPVRPVAAAAVPPPHLTNWNGWGGFTQDGGEYVTLLTSGATTPAPWVNVIANPDFGFMVSAEGSATTWAANSQQNHLTPWSNDAVQDPPGEAFFLRDEESGDLWSPTALPIRQPDGRYEARHGQGFSRFIHTSHGIETDLLQFVPVDDPIKICRLRITNQTSEARHLSVTAYAQWLLGAAPSPAALIVTAIDPTTGALFATNCWNLDFGQRVAFADLAGQQTSHTGDRGAFLGRGGTAARPLALSRPGPLPNTTGAGLDPCAALQTLVNLAPLGTGEVVFLLGQTATHAACQALIAKYRAASLDAVLDEVHRQWDDILGAVQVKTPDAALDLLLNRWLLYQTLSCRIWARAGFYQASGAFGFRDQLQDVMALCVTKPAIARGHVLRAAARQFIEGDVQHWWLPENGRGIRTRIADDRIWLAFVTAHYVAATADTGVLDEMVPFLVGPALLPGQAEAFFAPETSPQAASLYDHCVLAINQSMATGAHGLPLIATGDWNDGMNRIGEQGKGESIWLGWFLHAAISGFIPLAEARDDHGSAAAWRAHAEKLRQSLEQDGWDGGWYRRAFFDDGTAVGSAENSQCEIDSIAQSWAVISGAAEPARAALAMQAVETQLVSRPEGLMKLFTPPFDNPPHDPGYIAAYPPGVRENGGQYTHAATWNIIAFAMLGQGTKAGELFGLINPITHTSTPAAAALYRGEPYVVAADVYSAAHAGQAGWTWYTGSAGWLYRAGLEWILGLRVAGNTLSLDPCIPSFWPGFSLTLRHGTATYDIEVENAAHVERGIHSATLDGVVLAEASLTLVDDGARHALRIIMGAP